MRRLATLAVVAALLSPTTASGQYTFGDWATDHGYSSGDVMPSWVNAMPWDGSSPIDSLDGIGEFDWTTTPTLEIMLDENQISSIESGAFVGMTNLEWLSLRNNPLSSIESGAFSGLTSLTTLSLWGNQISSIESGDFSGLTSLTTLNLWENQISSIESGTFSGLTNLKELYLHDNQLSSIDSVDFSGLTNLTELRLNGNQISNIESGDFGGLTNLTELNLGDNQVLSIDSVDFSGLTNLTELWLNGNQISNIESGDFGELTNLAVLNLSSNQLSSIEPGDFGELPHLTELNLSDNPLSSIESGVFSGLAGLESLNLNGNTVLTELNLSDADFSSLTYFHVRGNVNIASVSLKNTVLNQTALISLLEGTDGSNQYYTGIGELDGITEMELSGVDFASITNLGPLYAMDDLTDLWLVDTQNVDAVDLDVLLDNLETIEGTDTEGILHMTYANFDGFNIAGSGLLAAWDAEHGHHVEFIGSLLLGDVNHDGAVDGLDVDPFVDVLLDSQFATTADMNGDGAVNGLDVAPFVAAVFGGGAHQIPEPSTLLLCIVALGVVGGWRKWKRA